MSSKDKITIEKLNNEIRQLKEENNQLRKENDKLLKISGLSEEEKQRIINNTSHLNSMLFIMSSNDRHQLDSFYSDKLDSDTDFPIT